MVFSKDLTQLLLVPEGKEGAAAIPDTTTSVPAGVLSHRALVTSLSVGEGSATFTSENGILYTKDMKTLVACPGGNGNAVVIPESVEVIGPDAFVGCELKSIVVRGAVLTIDLTAFSDVVKSEATVVLCGDQNYSAHKAVWKQLGFTKFQEPVKPGDSTTPKGSTDTQGMTYTLLDDYTLSVSWEGNSNPEANLIIPSSVNLSGITYRVSTISDAAFKDQTSLTSVVIPSSVSTLGDYAFAGCTNLTQVSLAQGLTTLGVSSFENTALEQVVLPQSVATIKDYALANNSHLTRIICRTTINSVAPTTLEGCMQVSILTPYEQDNLYTWTPGIFALGNHIEPYGILTTDESLTLTQDETSELFASTEVFIPTDASLTYAYPAACVSVDTQGKVTGIASGSVDVIATLILDDIELARGLRSVEVVAQLDTPHTPSVIEQDEAPDYVSAPLPLTESLLAMSGGEIQPRGITASGVCGTCPWDIVDGVLTIRAGTLGAFTDIFSVPWYQYRASIASVVIQSEVIVNGGFGNVFYGCLNLTTIEGLSNFNTSNATRMDGMFMGCSRLTTLDLSSFNITNVTYVSDMFNGCTGLTTLDLSSFDTTNVINMGNMFNGCSSLSALDLSNFNTAKVTTMEGMFNNCINLSTLNLLNFSTSDVTNMSSMFNSCSKLISLDLSRFDTSNVIATADMFSSCSSLTALDLSSFNTSKVTNMRYMFNNCSSLTALGLSNLSTANVTDMSNMFHGCSSLSALDLSSFDTASVIDMGNMFKGCSSLSVLDLSSFSTANVTNMISLFSGCSKLTVLNLVNFSTIKVTNMSNLFNGCSSLTALDLSHFNTASTTDMSNMFLNCSSLSALSLSNFNTANATSMNSMFNNCSSLTSLDLSKFDTTNVVTTADMFSSCSSLTLLDVSNFNTAKVTNMRYMFNNCSSLTALDLSGLTTVNVTDMSSMFYGCSNLSALDLTNFDTAGVTTSTKIFTNTQQLATVKLGSAYTLELPQKSGINTATGATYSGKWVSQATNAEYDYNAIPKNTADTYDAQLAYTLSFDTQGGSTAPENQSVVAGKKATPVVDPTKTGHMFVGWYKEAECINAWDFTKDFMPAKNLTLYASWKVNVHTVTFQTNGGSALESMKANYGTKLTAPTPPTKQGYAFVAWYRDRTLAIPWNFDTDTITNDIELFAKWTAVVDIDVPIDPRIDIDAQGTVVSGGAATKPFVSRSARPVAVTEIACTTTLSTKVVFPNELQWPGIKISVAKPSDPFGGTEIRLGKSAKASFEIPAAPEGGTSELPLVFGLEFLAGTSIAYVPAESGTPVATLTYTFALL